MRSQGLRPRDVVALCSDDHMDFAMPLFAALYLGAVCSPWDPTSDADGVCHRMNITKPKMVFVSGSAAAVVAKAAKMAEHDVKIIVFGHVPGFLEFERIIAEPGLDDVEKFIFTAIQSSGEIASILFSSGTTGPPKGVALSHRALIMLWSQEEPYGMAGNVCLTFAPTDWITTTDSIIMTLFLKIPRIILPLFGERTACAFIERYKASWLNLSPTIINRLVKSDVTSMYDLSSVSRVTYAGSRLSAASYTALTELMPKVQIRSYYGLTESCCFVAIQSAKSQPGSCGEIAENSQVKVIDPSTGRTLEPGQRGEILLKFAVMMNCYYNDPQATAQAIDEEGWLHSGDLGYYDEGGEIFVIDRMKDVIRIGDDPDISPSEIEGAILSHPGVKEVALVGHPRPQDDESLIAFVVRSEDLSDKRNQVMISRR